VPRLTRTLEAYRLRHDFVRIADERSATVIRPQQALQAMNRNPGNVVVLLDAGAIINSTVDELRNVNGDVGLYMRIKRARGRRFQGRYRTAISRLSLWTVPVPSPVMRAPCRWRDPLQVHDADSASPCCAMCLIAGSEGNETQERPLMSRGPLS